MSMCRGVVVGNGLYRSVSSGRRRVCREERGCAEEWEMEEESTEWAWWRSSADVSSDDVW